VILQLCDIEALQVQARSHFYSLWIMRTNICFDLCDPVYSKGQLPTPRSLNLGEISCFNFVTHFCRELQFYKLIDQCTYSWITKYFSILEYVHRFCVIWSILISCSHVSLCLWAIFLLQVSHKNSVGLSLRPHLCYLPCPLNSF
jgi:hypothetical protein